MIQHRLAKLLTSLQAVSTHRAILRLLLVRKQMLVIFAACEGPCYQILLTLSLFLSVFIEYLPYVCSRLYAQVNLPEYICVLPLCVRMCVCVCGDHR